MHLEARHTLKLGSYSVNRDSKIEILSPSIFTFQKDGSKVLEKDISGLFKWLEAFKKICVSEAKKGIQVFQSKCYMKKKVADL